VYDHAAKGSVLIGGGSNLPWRSRDYETMRYQVIPDLDAWRSPCRGAVATRPCVREPDPQRIVDEMLDLSAPKGSWVIITESTKVQAALLNGQPGILEGIVDRLRVTPRAQEVLRSRDADVFRIFPAPPGS
jgi:hypothetical protein